MKPSTIKPSSKLFLEEISRYCYSRLTLYKFNKTSLTIDEKYREGRITALNYISDLAFYFMQEEKQLKEHFIEELKKQIEMTSSLKTPAYRQGILDTVQELQQEIDRLC
ncbi:MAG: hypothetical protein U9Q90_00920 [Campylobacterota bacterium]|nr:hypothetical protein [Campylobacterota bacterium]